MNPFIFDSSNTFCINLDSKPDRWERMQSRFEHFNMTATRWPAATSETIHDNFPHYLNDGQKGCAQSHIDIWRHIVEHDISYALVLEDDASFDGEWDNKLAIFQKTNQDAEWYMIVLNGSEPIANRDQWICTRNQEQYLTGGYIISRKGAEVILHDFRDSFFASDWMTSRIQFHGHSYCYFPWLIIQEGKDTSIGSQVAEDHAKVLRCLNEIDYSIENYI